MDSDRVSLMNCDVDLMPDQIQALSSSKRKKYVQMERSRLLRNFRILHGVLGLLEILVAAVLLVIVYFIPLPAETYAVCLYTLLGQPAIPIPLVLSLGCVSPFLLAIIVLLFHGLIYHLVTMTFMYMDTYVADVMGGKYNNRFRWIFRGVVYPAYYLIALHVSGVRDIVFMLAMLFLCFFTEMLRWITERKTTYVFSTSKQLSKVEKRSMSSLYASALMSGLVAATQLIYWIIFVFQGGVVPLISWIYGLTFAVLYIIFAVWVIMENSAEYVPYGARLTTEYVWTILDSLSIIALTIAAMFGAIYS